MPLPGGYELGPYQVIAPLGAGAMGEVYRARDKRLGREVAIKVLPQAMTGDAERLARFEREAKVLAALSHPNIATIHGIEEADGVRGLVIELVAGETLAELIARRNRSGRPLPVAEALGIARQIAAALEAAHEKGIVHRDLKPANVMIDARGVVKILDFGLAKITTRAAAEPAVTLLADGTREGLMLGTTPYMSPDQARGFGVDQSADVWAFACVLYELLTGRRAFDGETTSDTVAAVLEHEPDWDKLSSTVPGAVRRLVQRCLDKNPRQRLKDIGAVRILVEDALAALESGAGASAAASPARRSRARLGWAAATVTGLALGIGAFAAYEWWLAPASPVEPVRLSIAAPGPVTPQLSGAISPDGRHLAFVATGPSGRSMLWIRTLASLEPRELPGTERAAHPFWSPDSRSIAFIADSALKRVELAGGPVQTLAAIDTPQRLGGAWGRDGVILFSPHADEIAAIPAAGGPVTTILKATGTAGPSQLAWPDFLPDGRHFLYYGWSPAAEHRGVYVGSLDSTDTKRLLESDIRAKYADPDYLLFLRDETLMAQPFDVERLALSGEPKPVADGIWFARGAHHASFSASRTGTLAYVNATFWDRQLVWFDRTGRRLGTAGPRFRDANGTPELSPDGSRIAIGRGEWFFGDVWTLDAARETLSRVTFNPGLRGAPRWSADGNALLDRAGRRLVRHNIVDGSQQTLLEADFDWIFDWSSRSGYAVLGYEADLWLVDLDESGTPVRYLETPVNETQAQLSPNGRWIAYTANETGRDEVYVQSFPEPGRKRQISVEGGAMPRWRGDGAELFYLAADQSMTAVPVIDAESLELGAPVPLFRAPLIVQGSESSGLPTAYDVTADGERFLLMAAPESAPPPMTVVLNWRAALEP